MSLRFFIYATNSLLENVVINCYTCITIYAKKVITNYDLFISNYRKKSLEATKKAAEILSNY